MQKVVKRIRKVPYIPNANEVESMIKTIDFPKYRMMIRLMYQLALRVGELVKIKRSDINFQSGTILINGKGHKQRLLALSGLQNHQLRVYMVTYPAAEYLFVNSSGLPYTTRGVRNIVYDACGDAFGHYMIHPHSLRHARATDLIKKDCYVGHVQQLLGHKHLTTTMIYMHYDVSHLRSAIAQADAR